MAWPINVRGMARRRPASFALGSLILGSTIFTDTRAAFSSGTGSGYVADFEGIQRLAAVNEGRFQGLRRVKNLLTNSATLTAGGGWSLNNTTSVIGATDPDGGTTAYTLTGITGTKNINKAITVSSAATPVTDSIWVRRISGSGTVSIFRADQGLTAINVTTSWQRFADVGRAPGTVNSFIGIQLATDGDVVAIWHPLMEDVTGQAVQAPSDYLDAQTNYDGQTVPGVRYFPYANGNTVVANVVIPGTGAYFTGPGRGLLEEPTRTNLALWCRDLTNVAWVKVNMTTALTATGADGAPNSATTLTASAGNATVLQTIVDASAQRVQSAIIRRRTGTGNVDMTQDGGVTWTTLTLTAAYQQLPVPAATLANPVIGFRIVTNGDAVDVDFVQQEVGAEKSSPIATTTVAVTRGADLVTCANPMSNTADSVRVRMIPYGAFPDGSRIVSGSPDGSGVPLYVLNSGLSLGLYDGTTSAQLLATITPNVATCVVGAYEGTSMRVARDGVAGTVATFDTNAGLNTTLAFGSNTNGTAHAPPLLLTSIDFHICTTATIAAASV